MKLLWGLGAAVLVALLQILLFSRKKTVFTVLGAVFKNILVTILPALLFECYILRMPLTAGGNTRQQVFFFLLALAFGLVFLFCYGVANSYLTFEEGGRSGRFRGLRLLCLVLVFVGLSLIFLCRWAGYAGLEPGQLLSAMEAHFPVRTVALPVLSLTALFGLLLFSDFTLSYLGTHKALILWGDASHAIVCVLITLGTLAWGLVFFIQMLLY